MNKLTVIGNVPNTNLSWERFECDVRLSDHTLGRITEYLLVNSIVGRRKVVANLDMGQLVALRASIDALVAAEAGEKEQEEK